MHVDVLSAESDFKSHALVSRCANAHSPPLAMSSRFNSARKRSVF
jgi:hypothetical protein